MITGIFDRSKPEQYGKALPLKEEILFGEDIIVMFTEDIDCSYPYTFDILVDVEDDADADTDLKLEKGQLHIICEGRQIKFQVDYTQIDLELIQGRPFEVYIGKVGVDSQSYVADKNGNPLDLVTGFIRFEKKFAAIDTHRTLTEFVFTKKMEQFDCSKHNETALSKELMTDLSSDTSESSRWRVSDVQCYQPDSTINAKVEILPTIDDRRKLKGTMNRNEPGSTYMFSTICKTVKGGDIHARKLREEIHGNFMISNVRFAYSDQDLKKYASTAEQKKEEELLLSVVKQQLGSAESPQSRRASEESLLLEEKLLYEEEDKLKSFEYNIQELKMELRSRDQMYSDREHMLEDMEKKREEEHSEIIRQLRGEAKSSEKYEILIQLLIFLSGCSLASFATFHMIRR